jgi:MFS family permease
LATKRRDFSLSFAIVQWLTTAYLFVVTIVMSTTAYVLKRFAPRKLFCVAVSLCLLGCLDCAVAPSFWWLLIGRLMQAVATGISTPLMFQLIFASIPRQKLGLYTGFASVIVSLAPALGPTYGGILTGWWTWRGWLDFVGDNQGNKTRISKKCSDLTDKVKPEHLSLLIDFCNHH